MLLIRLRYLNQLGKYGDHRGVKRQVANSSVVGVPNHTATTRCPMRHRRAARFERNPQNLPWY